MGTNAPAPTATRYLKPASRDVRRSLLVPGVEPSDLDLLTRGEFLSWELTPHGSNYTFLAELELNGRQGQAIYKPRKGEIPLWDFPSGTLFKRECAAYLLSRILGWDFIPLTVIRDGPHGIGSAQLFVDHDPKENYYTISTGQPRRIGRRPTAG